MDTLYLVSNPLGLLSLAMALFLLPFLRLALNQLYASLEPFEWSYNSKRPANSPLKATLCRVVHEFRETCHSVTLYFMKEDSKQCCDTTTPESIHTKDESKRGSAFAFIFGVN